MRKGIESFRYFLKSDEGKDFTPDQIAKNGKKLIETVASNRKKIIGTVLTLGTIANFSPETI